MKPLDEKMQDVDTKTATFALGCFWGPDAQFGALPGVVRTRVGYAGGETENPTYHDMDGHTETVQIEYDPDKISYEELLDVFWGAHDAAQRRKTQYKSIIFYETERQLEPAEKSKAQQSNAVKTEIQPLIKFYVAEDYHQKYRLRNHQLMDEFSSYSDEHFRESTVAARVNGFIAGYGSEEQLAAEGNLFDVSEHGEETLQRLVLA